ncbi:LysR family transcriptional regulator [Nocardioides zeae]|uniref:LysR family transcriptional regulator n=1 Tax=Nocardioides imazamoxiresistens TaxID=3231893 RepID=A0ABU3PWH5_9ACTN|nr:LysR family transcriptional regulator [Nocardioides zeae]MDT9593187.1 LysR family transcriptional regulator [Nocardioides zeae]
MKLPAFTLVQLRYFAAAAEEGSMTSAARRLVVSQSAVSTAVAQLERELGVQLLIRHHARGLTLTPAGRAFHAELRAFLAHSQELAEAATSAGTDLAGSLHVGCFETIAPFWLPEIVTTCAQRHPRVELSIREGEHAALKRGLREGDLEAAVMYAYDLEPDLEATVVGSATPYVMVAADHPFAERGSVALAELADDPLVMLDLPHTSNYFHSLFEIAQVNPRVRHRSRGYETVRAMVAAGHGYAVLNQRPAHALTYGGAVVVTLPIEERLPALDIVTVRVGGTRPTRKAAAFVRLCAAVGERLGVGGSAEPTS